MLDRFDYLWRQFADQGACDVLGSTEYQRVKSEWKRAGRPADVAEFIASALDVNSPGTPRVNPSTTSSPTITVTGQPDTNKHDGTDPPVSDVDILTQLVEKNPDNDIVRFMLTDALMSDRGMLRSEADRHVARVIAVANEAREITLAAELLADHHSARNFLYRCVRRDLVLQDDQCGALVVVAGDEPPLVCAYGTYRIGGYWTEVTVAVGARWILQTWAIEKARQSAAKLRRINTRKRRS